MKIAVITLVLLGVLAAICAAVLITTLTSRSGAGPTAAIIGEPDVEVLVAAHDLPAMSVVDSGAVTLKKVPKSEVPANALLNSVQVVGKVITDRMLEKQVFTKNCFAREGTGVYLASAVPPGKRAMSITLTDWSGMAGLLYPGSVVDVLVSFKSLGDVKVDEMMATTLLQGLQVLAIGSQSIAQDQFQDKETGALAARGQINTRMVTLLVDPKQAEILQLAMQNGSISLSMRNPLDTSREARRLTRAREIAPDRGQVGITSAEATVDPFEPEIKPAKRAASEVKKLEPVAPELWETLIVRGTVSEKRTFSMPEDADQSEKAAPGAKAAPVAPATPAVKVPADLRRAQGAPASIAE
jgi:pilus assembly protein CpaB